MTINNGLPTHEGSIPSARSALQKSFFIRAGRPRGERKKRQDRTEREEKCRQIEHPHGQVGKSIDGPTQLQRQCTRPHRPWKFSGHEMIRIDPMLQQSHARDSVAHVDPTALRHIAQVDAETHQKREPHCNPAHHRHDAFHRSVR